MLHPAASPDPSHQPSEQPCVDALTRLAQRLQEWTDRNRDNATLPRPSAVAAISDSVPLPATHPAVTEPIQPIGHDKGIDSDSIHADINTLYAACRAAPNASAHLIHVAPHPLIQPELLSSWSPLIGAACDTFPSCLLQRANDYLKASDTVTIPHPSDDDSDADENDDPAMRAALDRLRRSAQSYSRLCLILRNLCTHPTFQSHTRRILIQQHPHLPMVSAIVQCMIERYAFDDEDDVARLLKSVIRSLLQFIANMLTPQPEASPSSLYPLLTSTLTLSPGVFSHPWRWVHDALIPSVVLPLLHAHSLFPDLASIATCIIHHALLCEETQANDGVQAESESKSTTMKLCSAGEQRKRAVEFVECADGHLLRSLLQATHQRIQQQITEQDEAMQQTSSSKSSTMPPITIWHWHPSDSASNEPIWLIHLLHFTLPHVPSLLHRIHQLLQTHADDDGKAETEAHALWHTTLRLVELACEVTATKQQKQSDRQGPGATDDGNDDDVQLTADALTSNAVFLLRWVQSRKADKDGVEEPATHQRASPTTDPDMPSSSSSSLSSPSSSSSRPSQALHVIDDACNAVISALGSIFDCSVWCANSTLLSALQSRLALSREVNVSDLLLQLLRDADAIDGGAMFSQLYKPLPGHTRHTKATQDPLDYANQFASDSNDNARPCMSALQPASPSVSVSSPRRTPYLLKSHLLRLLSSLVYHCPVFQSSFGSSGIYACMEHSVIDDHNPLMREHAILALRNLMEGNEENQRVVAELRVEEVANRNALHHMGIDATLQPETGKVRLSKK